MFLRVAKHWRDQQLLKVRENSREKKYLLTHGWHWAGLSLSPPPPPPPPMHSNFCFFHCVILCDSLSWSCTPLYVFLFKKNAEFLTVFASKLHYIYKIKTLFLCFTLHIRYRDFCCSHTIFKCAVILGTISTVRKLIFREAGFLYMGQITFSKR